MPPSFDRYQPNSPILILTLDSFHKKREGETSEYNFTSSIFASQIAQECKTFLCETRKKIFGHLKAGEAIWKNSYKERDYNTQLVLAKDFCSEHSNVRYLPAMERYDGHFFDGLGEKGKDDLRHSNHHLLILSALYGFLKPFEPIQFYSCQFGDKNICYNLWTHKKGISKVIIEYIKTYKITKIFDFTACDVTAYHEAIDWDVVTTATSAEVLHCYHLKTVTDKALKYYGRFVRDHILVNDVDNILRIQKGSIIDEIECSDRLRSLGPPPEISHQIVTDLIALNKLEDLLNIKKSSIIDEIESSDRIQSIISRPKTSQQIGTDWLPIIKAKEKKNIEFKQSLRWSFKTHEEKKLSEYIAMRGISSMLNSEGGMLFIGVSDTGDIVGIENDYKTLQKQNGDGYLLHFDNLINNYLGREFHQYVTATIELINGKEVCVVQIRRSDKPSFVKSKDASGMVKEEFFIRGTVSSQPLGMKDTLDYIKSHWKKI